MEHQTPDGYPKFAEVMGEHPEQAIVRRFGSLNMLNILRLQAELSDLERQLKQAQWDNRESMQGNRRSYALSFREIRVSNQPDNVGRQHQLLGDIQKKLADYNPAILQMFQLNQLPGPSQREVNVLKDMALGNFPQYPEDWFTKEEYKIDLVKLFPRQSDDWLSRWVRGGLLDLYHRWVGGCVPWAHSTVPGTDLTAYAERNLELVSKFVSSILAAGLPSLGMFCPYGHPPPGLETPVYRWLRDIIRNPACDFDSG
ncbi:hypothetical protein BJX64DRAFT_269399 [Aspergillus heterothallicus]